MHEHTQEKPERFKIVCKKCKTDKDTVWSIEDREVRITCKNCGISEDC